MYRIILAISAISLFLGCSPASKTPAPMPELASYAPEPIPKVKNPGSLYQPRKASFLFADNRARRVGDIVQVNILETSQATSEAETTADKESNINLGVENFLGQSKFMGIPGSIGETPLLKAGSTTEFDNNAETSRETTVTATIAARVVRLLPNGLMEIQGSREILVNGENQIITVQGLIRSRDIGPDNRITSSQLADAKIHFYGQGVLAEKQRPGWGIRLVDNLWPF